jgi:hypothetical protein
MNPNHASASLAPNWLSSAVGQIPGVSQPVCLTAFGMSHQAAAGVWFKNCYEMVVSTKEQVTMKERNSILATVSAQNSRSY